jgi:alkanesulfonate monooxygenase SsuD/methylene tetrahydromethanopterin reductase-like flavin-dependent oxidoreductase (luciferase family)
LLKEFDFLQYLKHDQSVPDSDVTPEYCAKHNWIIGSPATVTEKLQHVHEEVGGFGHLLVFGFDYVDDAEAWRRSLELLAREVLPKVRHLSPSQ